MTELQQSWAAFRDNSRVSALTRSALCTSAHSPQKAAIAHLPDSYQPPDKVVRTKPNSVLLEQQRLERAAESNRELAERSKMTPEAFLQLGRFLSERVLRAYDLSQEQEEERRLLEILSGLDYLNGSKATSFSLVKESLFPALQQIGGFNRENVRLLVCGLEFGALASKFPLEVKKILGEDADRIFQIAKPFSDLKFNRMAAERKPFEQRVNQIERLRRQGNPDEEDFCSFTPALNTNRATISQAQVQREKAFLTERIPVHNQQVALFVEYLVSQGQEAQATQYAKVNLIPMVQNYDSQEDRAKYQHWLRILKAEQMKECIPDEDANELRSAPDIKKSMISFQLAKEDPENRIATTQSQMLRNKRIQENIAQANREDALKKRAETVLGEPQLTVCKRPKQQANSQISDVAADIPAQEESAISEHIYRLRVAQQQKAERELANQMLGRTLAGRAELEMTAQAAEITERMTRRAPAKERRPLLLSIEIEIARGKTGKLFVYQGDSVQSVVLGFCKTYSIREEKLIKLKKHVETLFKKQAIPFEPVSDDDLLDAFRKQFKGRPTQNQGVRVGIQQDGGSRLQSAGRTGGSMLESQHAQDVLTKFVSDDLWDELGLVQ